jgi:transmembrane sensor
MNSEERTRDIISQEAADWFVANGEGLNEEQRSQFESWLKTSSVHVEEYLGIAGIARDLREATAAPELSIDALLEHGAGSDDLGNARRSDRRAWRASTGVPRGGWRHAVALAAGTALVVVGVTLLVPRMSTLAPSGEPATAFHFATHHGEQLTQRLADDSVLHLNTDSAVAVRFDHAGRHVEIEHGQVVFEVAHDPARPFRVRAGLAEVVAVGTKFDVYLRPGSTQVTVLEGRVTVAAMTPGAGGDRVFSQGLVLVHAGEQVLVREGASPSSPAKVDAQRSTAWLRHQIAFEHEPLALVAAEFNRYATKPIEIETPALAALKISGVFAENDSESFIALLRSLEGVRVEVTATRIRVFKT